MNDILFPFISLAISITAGLIHIPKIVLISKRKNLYDEAGGRKPHKGNIPRIAGLAFFPAFIISFFITYAIAAQTDEYSGILLRPEFILQLGTMLAGLSMLYMVGFVDDLISVPWRIKFLVQFLATLMPVISGMSIGSLDGLFGIHEIHPAIGGILTVLAVMLIINAYNLIDGIDGLCSSLSILATAALGIWFITHGMLLYCLISTSIAGITAVYFYYNTTSGRFRTFMGDTGSTNLGYIIAFLALAFYNTCLDHTSTGAADNSIMHPLSFILGLVSLPLFDTVRVFAVRISKGLSPFHPDKRHLHHKLLNLGLTHLRCTLICIILQGCYFCMNYLMKEINVSIVLAADLAFMLLYTGAIDLLVKHRLKNCRATED